MPYKDNSNNINTIGGTYRYRYRVPTSCCPWLSIPTTILSARFGPQALKWCVARCAEIGPLVFVAVVAVVINQ